MSVVFFLLPIALILAGGFLGAFIWATRSGEFDDLETPAHRILFDDLPSSPAAQVSASHDGSTRNSTQPR